MKTICNTHSPHKIEIGSFVSPRVLPIMSDTVQLFNAFSEYTYDELDPPDAYALVPNKIGLHTAINHGVRNFSFITSVSNAFQVKNTGKNLDYKKTELKEMLHIINELKAPAKTKLYVSCINECPLTGLIDSDLVIHEILSYNSHINTHLRYDEICISDTMGTLKCKDFEYIVNSLLRFGITKSQISVHLHVNGENTKEARQILFACFKRGINQFDVSTISEGGCSVTMEKSQTKPNMTYDFFYSVLKEYNIEELD
jgi:isopropylmalate/homocitrate/citramalate synthase